MIFSYSLSRPLLSRHRRYITEASTLAGLKVFGSLSNEITLNSIVRTFCVGFQRSQGNSPDCGSSTGGCKILIHKSPFWKFKNKFLYATDFKWHYCACHCDVITQFFSQIKCDVTNNCACHYDVIYAVILLTSYTLGCQTFVKNLIDGGE